MTEHTGSEQLLPSRSAAERRFYLMILTCAQCGSGPFDFVSSERSGDEHADIWYVRCRSCRAGRRLLFDRATLLVDESAAGREEYPVVNPTQQASELLDVGQWLALFYAIISATADQHDRNEVRRLGYEATLCLEEALKFYGPDGELPGPSAFFTESSTQRFREHPEQFARERLHQMREKLPSLRAMQVHLSDGSQAGSPSGFWARLRRWFRRSKKRRASCDER